MTTPLTFNQKNKLVSLTVFKLSLYRLSQRNTSNYKYLWNTVTGRLKPYTPNLNLIKATQNSTNDLIKDRRPYSTEVPFLYIPKQRHNIQQYPILAQTVIGHINKFVFTCSKPNCASFKCNGLCNSLLYVRHKGNFTHTPPPGSRHLLISVTDINGNPQNQYFVYNDSAVDFTQDPTSSSDTGLVLSEKTRIFSKKSSVKD